MVFAVHHCGIRKKLTPYIRLRLIFKVTSYGEGITQKFGKECCDNSSGLPQPAATVLVYLENVESGGETDFLGKYIKVQLA